MEATLYCKAVLRTRWNSILPFLAGAGNGKSLQHFSRVLNKATSVGLSRGG